MNLTQLLYYSGVRPSDNIITCATRAEESFSRFLVVMRKLYVIQLIEILAE